MIERTEQRFGLKPNLVAADTAYGSAPMLNWLVEEKGIAPHIPVIDKSAREDDSFSRADFRYDADEDVYICPADSLLRTSGTIVNENVRLYRGATADCRSCPLKPRCCPREPMRKIPRSIYDAARDVARSLFGTGAYAQSRRDRKKVEMQFAHLKRILRLDRLRLSPVDLRKLGRGRDAPSVVHPVSAERAPATFDDAATTEECRVDEMVLRALQ